MNICNQLPSTTCVHVSQRNIGRDFGMSNGVGTGDFRSEVGSWQGGGFRFLGLRRLVLVLILRISAQRWESSRQTLRATSQSNHGARNTGGCA